jgi:hypothetical protein
LGDLAVVIKQSIECLESLRISKICDASTSTLILILSSVSVVYPSMNSLRTNGDPFAFVSVTLTADELSGSVRKGETLSFAILFRRAV